MKITFQSPEVLNRAVQAGLTVHWQSGIYTVTGMDIDNLYIVSSGGSLKWPGRELKEFYSVVSQDVSDFLEAFIFANELNVYTDIETGTLCENDLENRTVYDFAPEIYIAIETFISGFRSFLSEKEINHEELSILENSFGGNCYFSLSGHGCGFRDDRNELGKEIHEYLKDYSGDKYRFEQMEFSNDETGLLDLSFLPEYREEYRKKFFKVNS
jgi:hypothetical protein